MPFPYRFLQRRKEQVSRGPSRILQEKVRTAHRGPKHNVLEEFPGYPPILGIWCGEGFDPCRGPVRKRVPEE